MNVERVKHFFIFLFFLLAVATIDSASAAQSKKEVLAIEGISEPVEIIKDGWGISHIYAQNQKDLFFAQGFNVARDRLFQLEIWRRQATGTMAEILGPKAVQQDIGARLLKARVDMKRELSHYHPQGEEIITSFAHGINAYIDMTRKNPGLLPLEFKLLGIKPGHWTPEVVVSRHNGLYRNASTEIAIAQSVKILGAARVQSLLNLHPENPSLITDEQIDLSKISREILELYNASRSRINFEPQDIVDKAFRAAAPSDQESACLSEDPFSEMDLGSNNWVVSGSLTFSSYPMMANDPHRSQQVPSLRYWTHLVAPGWNVLGGGEPALPGISIGHNEYGAWGLTIFSVDQEDLYIYETNPYDPNQYRYQGHWEDMKTIRETILVKGKQPVSAHLKYTRHGPVLHEDLENHKAYALRASWLEIGGAPYLASLRMDQAQNWEEFREACSFSRTPSENMVWADKNGNIGWQAVGITPVRKNWNGLLPVPGDGRYEWEGFIPIKELPHIFNPPEGFFATANQYNVPRGYSFGLGFMWTDPYRFARIQEVLRSGRKFTLPDMIKLQQDVLSIPARTLVSFLEGLHSTDETAERARKILLGWNFALNADSVAAAIYRNWERLLSKNVWDLFIPEEARSVFPSRSLKKMIDFLTAPDGHFGPSPIAKRDDLLIKSLEQGISELCARLGPDMDNWQYGQEKFHHVKIRHMLSRAVNSELRSRLDIGPFPRGGDGFTVNMTNSGYNQTSGASFRIIADLEDWDLSVGTNCPGQSGDPDNSHYSDLFVMWAEGKYFPVFFSRGKIESVAEKFTILKPRQE